MFASKIIDKLTSDFAIRMQILVSLETNHIHNCIRRHYENSFKSSSGGEIVRRSRGRAQKRTIYSEDDQSRWDWNGLPKRRKLIVLYHYLSTLCMIYTVFKNLCTNFIESSVFPLIGINLHKPLHCYFIGRFQIQQFVIINTVTANLAALTNLLWPLFQWNRPHRMTTPYFLMFSSRDLDRYYKIVEGQKRALEEGAYQGGDLLRSLMKTTTVVRNQPPDQIESFFHEIMSHTIPLPGWRAIIQLRPNRTREARRKLTRLTATLTMYYSSFIILVAVILTAIITSHLLDDRRYVRDYFGCDARFDSEAFNSRGYSVTFTWHRLVTFVYDFIENLILWGEMGTIAYGIEFAVITNYDLILYWQYLHRETTELSARAKTLYVATECECSLSERLGGHSRLESCDRLITNRGFALETSSKELGEAIHRLQHEIHDFIREIEKVDIFLSDILTVSLSLWVAIFTSYVYVSPSGLLPTRALQPDTSSHAHASSTWLHIYILSVPMSLVASIFLALLTLHRCCLKTYPIICSLMAYHQSLDKKSFLPILDCFYERRTCYRLFRMNPFMPTTVLSIIGWSFSCFFIVRGLVRGHE